MREVEIDKGQLGVYCPYSFTGEHCGFPCFVDCAWFQILDLAEVKGVNKDGPHAYCQDHCIGRIKT